MNFELTGKSISFLGVEIFRRMSQIDRYDFGPFQLLAQRHLKIEEETLLFANI